MVEKDKQGSHKNIWYGLGRQRIEIPKSVLKSKIFNNVLLKGLYLCSLGYYPKAKGHFTYRKNGLPENFLFYCVDGHGWYKINGEKYEVGPNEFFILPQNVEHSYGSSESHPWSIYWVHFGGESLAKLNATDSVKKHFKPFYIKDNGDIVHLFTRIFQSLEGGYSTDNLTFINMCLYHFISLFIYNAKYYAVNSKEKSDWIDEAVAFMQAHINTNITLDELCKHCNYSTSRFSSLFKQKTGYAPIDYFIQMKMQKATQQLDFSNRSIKDIAITMGFDDPYYFSKRFKKVIGVSPQKYRLLKKE
jgi:AraC family transcriptional regulator of arabinose operon